MDMHARNFLKRAKNIGPLLAGRENVRVTIGGNNAYSSGGHINLPMGDFSDPDWVAMSRGWIDHEFGHEKHTEHTYFRDAAHQSMTLKNILNALEDARMEREVGKEFPGAKSNLNRLVELAMKKELFCAPSPENPIHAFILYHGRRFVTNQHALTEYADSAEQLCRQALGDDIVDKLKSLIESTSTAKNTSEVFDIAVRIFELLKENEDQSTDDDQDGDCDSQSGDSDSDENTSDDDADNSDAEDQSTDDNQDGDSDSQSGDSDSDENTSDDDAASSDAEDQSTDDDQEGGSESQSGDSNSEQSTPQSGASKSTSSVGSTEGESNDQELSAQDVIDAFLEDQQDNDFHENLKQMLEEGSKEQSEEGSESQGTYDGYDLDVRNELLYKNDVPEGEGLLVNRFYRTLNRALTDKARTLTVNRRRGTKIIGSKLAGVLSGNTSVFQHQSISKALTAGVSILVDASGSMSGFQMRESNKTAYALSKALNRMKIDSQVVYFGAWDEEKGENCPSYKGDYLYVAKDYKAPLIKERFAVCGRGSTPTHEGMMFSIMSLGTLNLDNKVIFIITDGDPNSVTEVVEMRNLATKLGIKIIPIGLDTFTVKGFEGDEFVTAKDSSEVNDALQNAIKLKLFA